MCELMCYPLFFPKACGGWYVDNYPQRANKHPQFEDGSAVTSLHKYVKYCTYQRAEFFASFGYLFQQWLLDQYSRWQEMLFIYIGKQQDIMSNIKARVAKFKDIDLSARRNKFNKIGRPFAIPASVSGSPAARKRELRDCVGVMAALGRQTHFITMTMNPRHPEVLEALRDIGCPHDPPEMHADIVNRVWRKKLKVFYGKLRDGTLMPDPCGKAIYIQSVTEYQKRYWPHVHVLVRVENMNGHRTWTPDDVDQHISAEYFLYERCNAYCAEKEVIEDLPPTERTRAEHAIRDGHQCDDTDCFAHAVFPYVKRFMVHKCADRFCGGETDKCKKFFPKEGGTPDSQRTFVDAKGFYFYRRRRKEDRYVVPYCPESLLEFLMHTNYEMTNGDNGITYIHTYQRKGFDFTRLAASVVEDNPQLELAEYQKCRHVGFAEAHQRFIAMPQQLNEPSCQTLFVHLENEQRVRFDPTNTPDEVHQALLKKDTPLMRYFMRHPFFKSGGPKPLKYTEYFENYRVTGIKLEDRDYQIEMQAHEVDLNTYGVREDIDPDAGSEPTVDVPPLGYECKKIVPKKKGICRIQQPNFSASEAFALASILREVVVDDWTDARTVNGIVYNTYHDAATALGIFINTDEFEMAMQYAINPNPDVWKGEEPVICLAHPFTLRRMFVAMSLAGASAPTLLEKFWTFLCYDLPHNPQRKVMRRIPRELRYRLLLKEIQALLIKERSSLSDINIAQPLSITFAEVRSTEKLRYSEPQLKALAHAKLNQQQRAISAEIIAAVKGKCSPHLININAYGGTGKTFLTEVIAARLRLSGHIVLASAPSGRAALKHLGGTTCHKCFGLPIQEEGQTPTSTLTANSQQGKLLIATDLLIVDEVAMLHKDYLSAIDKVLQDLMGNQLPFGGKHMLFLGDFRQLPPVVKSAGRLETVNASVCTHPLWRSVERRTLTIPMRDDSDPQLATFVRSIGDGIDYNGHRADGYFWSQRLPNTLQVQTDSDEALNSYFTTEGFPAHIRTMTQLRKLANSRLYKSSICTFTNERARYYNESISAKVQQHFNEPTFTLRAVEEPDPEYYHHAICTPEYMSMFEDASVPSHELHLFRGCFIMLVRNFLLSRDMSNGSLFIVVDATRHTLHCMNVTPGSDFFGCVEVLFRFKFAVTMNKLFKFNRVQFPVRIAYAGTVHKLQGHTVPDNGKLYLDFQEVPFAHSHTYVALGRAQSSDQVSIVLDPKADYHDSLIGVVYRELSDYDALQ